MFDVNHKPVLRSAIMEKWIDSRNVDPLIVIPLQFASSIRFCFSSLFCQFRLNCNQAVVIFVRMRRDSEIGKLCNSEMESAVETRCIGRISLSLTQLQMRID